MCSSRSSSSASSVAAGGRFAHHVAALQDVADQVAGGRVFGPLRAVLRFRAACRCRAGSLRRRPGPCSAAACMLGIVVVVLVGQIDARPRHAQHVLQPAADEGVMIVRGRRQRKQLLVVGFQQDVPTSSQSGASRICSRAMATSSANIACGSKRDLRQAHGRREAIGRGRPRTPRGSCAVRAAGRSSFRDRRPAPCRTRPAARLRGNRRPRANRSRWETTTSRA